MPYSLDNDVGPQGTHVALLNGMHGTMGGVLELTAVLWLERTRDTILGLEMMRDTMLGLEMTIDAILGLEMTRDTILGLEMMGGNRSGGTHAAAHQNAGCVGLHVRLGWTDTAACSVRDL